MSPKGRGLALQPSPVCAAADALGIPVVTPDRASAAEEVERVRALSPDLLIVDLTNQGWDYAAIFAALERQEIRAPILAFTTHVLAKSTQPYHGRCDRVVTKETFTQELPQILKSGVSTRERAGVSDDIS